ncbi:HNH endonuclease signature motif containing protein [Gulosibacter sp. ACHW.36C]|uniref:HNH endonuclease n=1 Tax=Gulosibacter sediminis TaxID=1729695 RepID=A0ABY4N1G2_9MICO|nr:HNH endonuclease signature motif containing protein [Gulosibacter sediminis]UQN15476.1 HNH endonuclease [Gulosibacter sediminis]
MTATTPPSGSDADEPMRRAPKHRPDGTTPPPETDGLNDALAAIEGMVLNGAKLEQVGAYMKMMGLAQAYAVAEHRTHAQLQERSSVASPDDLLRLNLRSIVAEFGIHTNESDTALLNRAYDAHRLGTDFVVWLDPLREAAVTMRHARALLRHAGIVPDGRRDDYATKVLEFATGETVAATDTYARKLAAELGAEEFEAAFEHEYQARHVKIEDREFGMSRITADIPTLQAHAMYDLMQQQAKALREEHVTEADEHRRRVRDAQARGEALSAADAEFIEDPRTVRQLMADLFVETFLTTTPQSMREYDAKGHSRVTATVSIVIPVLNLLNPDAPRDVATLNGMMPVSMTEARDMVSKAKCFQRIFTDPITGHVLTVDTRTPTPSMRRFLQARDQVCLFPGCRRPAHQSELDHTKPWAAGGNTDVENLGHLCPKHHTLKHQRPWACEQLGGGKVRWRTPRGEWVTVEPRPVGPIFKPVDDQSYDAINDPAPF